MSSRSKPETISFIALATPGQGEIRDRGSRFLALALPLSSEEEVADVLDGLRRDHRGATHVCWAWRLGAPARERSSDAGEPAGTAGVPILQVLRGERISDALIAVVRWFGGTKLGKGGLARAYAAAAREALRSATRERRVPECRFDLSFPYDRIGSVRGRIDAVGARLLSEDYGETVRLVVSVEAPRAERFEESLADLGPSVSCDRPAGVDGPGDRPARAGRLGPPTER